MSIIHACTTRNIMQNNFHGLILLWITSIDTLNWESISLQSSYYIDNSSVVYSPGQVLTVERIRSSSRTIDCAYGSDTGGCNTLHVLQYLRGRFGPVSSFSGSYRADSWTLQISRQNSSGVFLQQIRVCQLQFNWYEYLLNIQAVHHPQSLVRQLLWQPHIHRLLQQL